MRTRTGILPGLRAERTPVALLVALVLVFNLLASFAATAANGPDAPAGFVICSVSGIAALPVSDDATPHGGDFCACGEACVHLACCAALPGASAEETTVYFPSPRENFLPLRASHAVAGVFLFSQGIRAPPLS
ncbi:hypothetical protein GR183_13955 [Stappia sp. GBMRC 2046]|uniref:DUF2946 domain-containing protein n=1 Tax=Stappia sediminis TaxID=2692190 RepID=A0A7X3S8N8_9HYPH|nr:hypothetical protein [Stappia sediminis]MXN66013.1 hypothetical protein [Stappia sediminis]